MSGCGAAPNDPTRPNATADSEAMRAWLDGEPAYATFEDGKVVIKNASSPIAGMGVILTGGVMTVDPAYLSKLTGAAPAVTTPGFTVGVGTPLVPIVTASPTTVTWPPAGHVAGYVDPHATTTDAAPQRQRRTPPVGYVVATATEARALERKLTRTDDQWPDVYVMFVGGSVIGRRFSTILITREANDMKSVGSPAATERARRWFLEQCDTRLMPGGVMVRL